MSHFPSLVLLQSHGRGGGVDITQEGMILWYSWLQAVVTWGLEVSSTFKTNKKRKPRPTVGRWGSAVLMCLHIKQGVLGDPSKENLCEVSQQPQSCWEYSQAPKRSKIPHVLLDLWRIVCCVYMSDRVILNYSYLTQDFCRGCLVLRQVFKFFSFSHWARKNDYI